MNYGNIKKTDIANGPGVRVSLFVSGCRRHCPHCFNSETWDFAYGTPFTDETAEELLAALAPGFIHGLTVLGGEPMEPENQHALLPLLRRVREAYPQKTVWCFTGCTLERDLVPGGAYYTADTDALLEQLDVLVDGEFIEARKRLDLRFRGSDNQRLIDMAATRRTGAVVPWEEPLYRELNEIKEEL